MDTDQQNADEAAVAAALVQRISTGDRSAEAELVERYEIRLRYVLLRQMAGYPDDVDDIVQNALMTVIVRLREQPIDDSTRLGGFIYGVARNLQRANVRQRARHQGDDDARVVNLADESARPDRLLAGEQTTHMVRRLLAELGRSRGSERDREVLIRLYILQQDRQQVCRDLDISGDHLRRVVHRAKRRLKALLLERQGSEALGEQSDA